MTVTTYNPGTREAVCTCHGRSTVDRGLQLWERGKAEAFVRASAAAGADVRMEVRSGPYSKIYRVRGEGD